MKILVGCEESQEVTKALRALGHTAYSCDLQECSGGYPQWHIQQNLLYIIEAGDWDMLIAFPPCTYITNSNNARYKENTQKREHAIRFVKLLWNAKIKRIAIENPIGALSTAWREPDQIIQPWQFGHEYTKSTCLWLKNLPLLKPTNIVQNRYPLIHKMPPGPERSKTRSKTPTGIAKAMADQWTKHIIAHQLELSL